MITDYLTSQENNREDGQEIVITKLKLYLFSSADSYQRQDQRHLPVEEKKDGSLTGPLTYVSGQTIGSKASASEKCQQKSDLKEQRTPETRQAGAPPRKRGWKSRNGSKWWIVTLGGTKKRSLTKAAPQADWANRLGAVMRIGATKTATVTTDVLEPQVVH